MSKTDFQCQHDDLLRVLIANPEHARLYMKSATFFASVNSLANLIPPLLDFLAERASETEEAQRDLLRKVIRAERPFTMDERDPGT